MFQRIGAAAYKADLKITLKLDKLTGHPHKNFRSIHIAGTNGKGSVAHYLASILQTAGYKTGLYTSPHIKDFRERIRINGKSISEEKVVSFVSKYKNHFSKIKPSFFEMTVAMAFSYFSDEKIDIAVVETGMGGRLDSTNIIQPLLSVIINIGLDHTQFLGKTYENIAKEKAGIIKENTPVIIGEYNKDTKEVFTKSAKLLNSQILFASDSIEAKPNNADKINDSKYNIYKNNELLFRNLESGLKGNYQRNNIITSIMCLEKLKDLGIMISTENIHEGLKNVIKNTGIRGRWEIISREPLIICDIGHNTDGIKEVVKQIKYHDYSKLHIIIGLMNDKNPQDFLQLLPNNAKYYFTRAEIPRSMDQEILRKEANKKGLSGKSYPDVLTAFDFVKKEANKNDIIFIGGSTFIVSDFICTYKK